MFRFLRVVPLVFFATASTAEKVPELQPFAHLEPKKGQLGFGKAIGGGADFDQDGYPDIVVSNDTSQNNGPGSLTVFSGKDLSILWSLRDPWNENARGFGEHLKVVQDLNGDGISDIIAGNPRQSGLSGAAFLVSGKDGEVFRKHLGPPGWNLYGGSIELLDDFDGDGFREYIIGGGMSRYTDLFSGQSGELLRSFRPIWGAGRFFEDLGDLDGDGVSDFIVGSDIAFDARGLITIFSGATFEIIHQRDGDFRDDRFGFGLVHLGDVDDDSVPDYAVGAPAGMMDDGTQRTGTVFAYSGKTHKRIYEVPGRTPGEYFGRHLERIGKDFVLASAQLNQASEHCTGRAEVFRADSGRKLFNLSCDIGATASGFGNSIAAIGDLNGDGMEDFAVADELYMNRGRVYLYLWPSMGPSQQSDGSTSE